MEAQIEETPEVTPSIDELADSIIDGLKRYFPSDSDKAAVIAKVRTWLRREVEQSTQRRIVEAQAAADLLFNQI